MQQSLHI